MSDDQTYRIVREELSNFVSRIENVETQMDEYKEMRKEIYAEANGRGYDTKALRKLIAIRKKDRQDYEEEKAVLELYLDTL